MAARRAIKPINWAALIERVSESDKNSLAAFKSRSEFYLKKMQENPETPPKIDWAFYKSKIEPTFVDKFQKDYDNVKVPYPTDKYTSIIDQMEKDAVVEIKQFIEESNKRIDTNTQEIQRLESLLKYGQMTMEDFRDAHPDLAMDPINKPTIFPHYPEYQPDSEETEPKASH